MDNLDRGTHRTPHLHHRGIRQIRDNATAEIKQVRDSAQHDVSSARDTPPARSPTPTHAQSKTSRLPAAKLTQYRPAPPSPRPRTAHKEDVSHADIPSRDVDQTVRTLARATHVPHARVSEGQSRSLTGTRPPMTRHAVSAAHPPSRVTDLPSWSCGFDSRHPLSSFQPRSRP
jgi:hypothetical protein